MATFAQLNMDSMSNINYMNTHGTFLNDIWGYTDEVGNEYGLIGAERGVGIVDVTIPSSPQEVFLGRWCIFGLEGFENLW